MTRALLALSALSATLLATPALAADPVLGEKEFNKCKTCHIIEAEDGTVIQKGGKTGPNLYGIVGRPVASVEGFRYGDGILALAATGAVWDEAALAAYMTDPTAYLREKTGDSAARSKMTFKLKEGGADVAAYLASIKPAQ
jgi:cytochrome c